MRTSVSAKRCPECRQVTALDTAKCLRCGHLFVSRFEGPPSISSLPLSPPPSAFPPPAGRARPGLAIAAVIVVLGIAVGTAAWLLGGGSAPSPNVSSAPLPASRPPLPQPPLAQAEALYQRIQLSMSLYAVTQAAGSSGSVVRSADPHRLALSYDFPGEDAAHVRVSLFRAGLSGDDYRVESVALYSGKHLVKQRAGE